MKRYVNCYPSRTHIYEFAANAKALAGADAYAVAVEIELPDPPDPPHVLDEATPCDPPEWWLWESSAS